MNKYNPHIHHRRSIRLKGYDYSQAGLYFITICCQDRACLFGKIKNGILQLNDAGRMVEKWYRELENKFPDIRCREMIVMPNHFHCIIENTGTPVGADLRVCPSPSPSPNPPETDNFDTDTPKTDNFETDIPKTDNSKTDNFEMDIPKMDNSKTDNFDTDNFDTDNFDTDIGDEHVGEHVGSPLRLVVQWFKTMTTNEYIRGVKTLGWQPFNGKLWQRNYYEHIIRDERAFHNISEYIINNPKKWSEDKFHTS